MQHYSVSFKPTEATYSALASFIMTSNRPYRPVATVLKMAAVFVASVLLVLSFEQVFGVPFSLQMLVGFAIGLAFFAVPSHLAMARSSRMYAAQFADSSTLVEWGPEGLTTRDATSAQSLAWSEVKAIGIHADHFVFSTGFLAVAIPLKDLKSHDLRAMVTDVMSQLSDEARVRSARFLRKV